MRARSIVIAAAVASLYACATTGGPPPVARIGDATKRASLPPPVREACPHVTPGVVYCEALVRTDIRADQPQGYGPSDLWSAYGLPSQTAGSGQTIAIVDAFDDPNAEADMYTYRRTFGLPDCTTLNHCFKKLNQRGRRGPYPKPNAGWATEISVDIDVVSATCPNCNILLIEAKTNSWRNLGAAVDEVVKLGATVVNNSYGAIGGGNPADYDHPGTILVASGGDNGYNGNHNHDPSDFPTVVAVGGTSLQRGGGSRGWTETVWSGTGSGCSKFAKPAWQSDTGCSHRTANDVAAVADPATGVAVYDTFDSGGWQLIGGDSVAAPINASAFALAGNAAQLDAAQSFYQTQNRAYLNDVTSGSDGTCSPAYLCTGEIGYDGPTGEGSPAGIGAY